MKEQLILGQMPTILLDSSQIPLPGVCTAFHDPSLFFWIFTPFQKRWCVSNYEQVISLPRPDMGSK